MATHATILKLKVSLILEILQCKAPRISHFRDFKMQVTYDEFFRRICNASHSWSVISANISHFTKKGTATLWLQIQNFTVQPIIGLQEFAIEIAHSLIFVVVGSMGLGIGFKKCYNPIF